MNFRNSKKKKPNFDHILCWNVSAVSEDRAVRALTTVVCGRSAPSGLYKRVTRTPSLTLE